MLGKALILVMGIFIGFTLGMMLLIDLLGESLNQKPLTKGERRQR